MTPKDPDTPRPDRRSGVSTPPSERYRRSSDHGGSSRRRSSKTAKELHKCRRRKLVLKVLLFMAILGLIGTAVLSSIQVKKARQEAEAAVHGPEQTSRNERRLQARIDELEEKLTTAVDGHFPALKPIQYDQVIRVDDRYVANVLFSVSKRAFDTTYEYQLKLLNTTTDVVKPKLRLFFFDESGLQIGIADTEGIDKKSLIPDEARTHSGTFKLTLEGEPKYYLFKIE